MSFKGILALLSAFILVGAAQTASAGVHLEPYVGYAKGSWEQGAAGADYTGVVYGGRLGYTMLGLAGGVEYMGGNLSDDAVISSDITPADLGLWVGYTFPILIRAYATYFFEAKSSFKNVTGTSKVEGTGMKLGVGFTFLPFLSVNLEYLTNEFDENQNGALTTKINSKATMVTLSVPLDI